jgi:hypothetical protein
MIYYMLIFCRLAGAIANGTILGQGTSRLNRVDCGINVDAADSELNDAGVHLALFFNKWTMDIQFALPKKISEKSELFFKKKSLAAHVSSFT